ncbi:hypothetical protein HAT86_00875 [Roseovarius gahaiensis]|uniref:Uncharacterized protein n=1 Tax=Roseovarius gahaiensis TaxID=2716691 RepID=A0A967BB27_9RHOB|nr:hypothetical protein [Roseovarius gahaiensis]NHQ73019.1 hypothetical protein [Roseovarius gahaiensis]
MKGALVNGFFYTICRKKTLTFGLAAYRQRPATIHPQTMIQGSDGTPLGIEKQKWC